MRYVLLFVLFALTGAAPPALCAAISDSLAGIDVEGYASTVQRRADGRLQVEFHADVDWPHAILRPRLPSNGWAGASTVALPVENPSDLGIDLFIRIGDDAGASWPDHSIAVRRFIGPHSHTTLLIALAPHDPHQMGMQDAPPPTGAEPIGMTPLATPTGRFDPARWASLYLVIWGRTGARSLIVGRPTPAAYDWGEATYTGLIDRYGQFARATWPGKVIQDGDFARARAAERRFDSGRPTHSPLLDTYGGWLAGPQFAGTGFFRVAQDGRDRWWLVTPAGHAFFSIGVDTATISDGRTFVEGRESMFRDLELPRDAPPLVSGTAASSPDGVPSRMPRFNAGRWINFYALNLLRKYGDKFPEAWIDSTLRRLTVWGFNTIGNWSSPGLWDRHQIPYVVPISVEVDGAGIPGGSVEIADLPDPYDAAFARAAHAAIAAAAAGRRDDPWLLGYFVDNELSWGDGASADPVRRNALGIRVLNLTSPSPAKQALIDSLRSRYGDIAALNQAWSVSVESWTAFAARPVKLSSTPTQACQEDLTRFAGQFADTYYRTIAQALHQHDPNHLYLGSRFAAQTDAALMACNRWCDVVSFNVYTANLGAALDERVAKLTRPVLIGEFNFSSTDRGPFGSGLVDVGSAPERGRAYASYLAAAAANPKVVGAHWFQYLDEPASGRLLDGENSPFGLVSVSDTPNFDVLEGIRSTNLGIWERLGSQNH